MSRNWTLQQYQAVAKKIQLKGRSKCRKKVELEKAIMKTREGRKAIHEGNDAEFAIQAVETCRKTGFFLLPREHVKFVEGEFHGIEEFRKAQNENSAKRASYLGKMRAIKELIMGQKLSREIHWDEPIGGKGFTLALRRPTPVAQAA